MSKLNMYLTKTFLSRVLIAVFGIPLLLTCINLGGIPFSLLLSAITALGLYEFYNLMKKKGIRSFRIPGMILGVAWIWSVHFFPGYLFEILVGMVCILLFISLSRKNDGASVNLASTILGIIYIPVLISTLILLHKAGVGRDGAQLVLMLFVTIWICDTFAYFAGTMMGKTPVAPTLSPKKTVEGSIAGVIGAVLTVFVFKWLGRVPDQMGTLQLLGFALLTGVFCQLGDFMESQFKRDAQVKDSSSLLLGHGGILDRFDAFFIAVPVIYLYIRFIF